MKDLFENFRSFSEALTADQENEKHGAALRKALKQLGMNQDATDTAPKPVKPVRVMPRRLESMLEDRGFWVNRFVDEGQYGKIWELEGRSGRRLAVKVVSVLLAGQQVDKEEQNYRWILDNRAGLPEEVKQHLVNVYSVERIPGKDIVDRNDQPYQMAEGALVIIMELLAPAPKEVLGTLLMDDPDEEIPTNKIKRTFGSEGAVTELVTNMAKSISPMMTAAVDRWSKWHLDTLIKQVTNAFLTGENPRENMYVDYGRLSRYHAPSFKPHGPRLLNIFFDRVDKMLPDFVKQYELDKNADPRLKDYFATRRQAVMDTTSKELDHQLFYNIKRQVVPMTYAYGPEARLGGADKYTQETFSEAEGLLNAMEYLHGKSFSPRDMHTGNVMMRPDSGQLVMVDVGLFRQLNEYKEKRFPNYGVTSLKYIPKKNPYINNGELYYEMHIGVDPDFQGQGVAGKIIMQFADEAQHPLFFGEARIVNPNLIKVLERMESNPRVERVEWGWMIR